MDPLDNETIALCRRAADFLAHRMFDEAISIMKQVVKTAPSPRTLSWLVAFLIAGGRTEEAIKQAIEATQSHQDSWETQDALGRAMAVKGNYNGAVQAFQASAALRCGSQPATKPAHYVLHDLEQLEYLSRNIDLYPEFSTIRSDERCNEIGPHMADIETETPAVVREVDASATPPLPLFIPKEAAIEQPLNTSLDFETITTRFVEQGSTFVIIDDLLSVEALNSLRHFCLGATVWRRSYEPGYVGAFPEDGFASVLLFEIADALRKAMPDVLVEYRLAQWWAFAYDQRLSGTDIHADDADISVNLWITRTEANLQRNHGGLIMWDRMAPDNWKFQDYNGDSEKVRSWLAEAGATETIIEHKANRAVLFSGHLFHRSDGANFAPGYENRRRNITFLFHRTR